MTTTMTKARPASAIVTLERELTGAQARFRAMLPRDNDTTNWIALTVSYFRQHPALLESDVNSRRTAILKGARTGLVFDGKQAYILSFRNGKTGKTECTFGVGYKGLLHLAAKYAGIQDAVAEVVHERDEFDIEYASTGDTLTHKPFLGRTTERGAVRGYYAKCTLANGRPKFVWLAVDDVERIKARAMGRTRGSGPWVTDEVEMGKKTAIIRLFKQIDVDPRVSLAADYDQQDPAEQPEEVVNANYEAAQQPASQADKLADAIESEPEPAPEAPMEPEAPPAPMEADVLTARELILCGFLPGKGGKQGAAVKKTVAEMDADELHNALDLALLDQADPDKGPRALGIIALVQAEMAKRGK